MPDKPIYWRDFLLTLGSAIGICVGANVYIMLDITDNLEEDFRRENDLIINEIELLYNVIKDAEFEQDLPQTELPSGKESLDVESDEIESN